MIKVFDMSWGESIAVRNAFMETWSTPVFFDYQSMLKLGYPDHAGDPALVELTRKIIKRQTGFTYKYILITNGATGAATLAMRTYAQVQNFEACITNDPPYYRLYPSMIESAGMTHITSKDAQSGAFDHCRHIYLIDSLSNPLGEFSTLKRDLWATPVIWDATYYGKVYAPGVHPYPDHEIVVGSYGKLTGLNGLRVGWIATNNLLQYEYMKEKVTAEYCGISAASTKIIMETVGKFTIDHWRSFEKNANHKLDYNRGEFSKLEKFFGGKPVGPYGMFYYSQMDSACKKLFTKSGIIWSPGSQLGTTDDFGRFNIGQDVQLVRHAVAAVLKIDKLK